MSETAVQRFERAVGRYSEENFFYIVHNYLGPIKSPFHKPQLISRLSGFFGQEEIQKRMIELLDDLDRAILSLLVLSDAIKAEEVIDLLSPRYGYATLFWRLSELQVRLILLSEEGQLFFNPLIEEPLRASCSLTSLFGAMDSGGAKPSSLSVELIRGYLSLALSEQRLGYRDVHATLFPSFDEQQLRPLVALLGDLLQRLGLIMPGKGVRLVDERIEALLKLSDRALHALVIAASIIGPPPVQSAAFAATLVDLVSRFESIEGESLTLLCAILAKRHGIAIDRTIIETMLTIGLIGEGEPHQVARFDGQAEVGPLLVDSDFSINYLGKRSDDDLLHRFATLSLYDRQRQWRVTKESVVRAFDSGLTFREIEAYLMANTSGSSAQSLIKQMALLDERYSLLTIYDGLALVADERVAHLVEHLPALAEHRIKKLAPTIFLMRRDSEQLWRKILTDAGQLVGSTHRQPVVVAKEEAINPYFFSYISIVTSPNTVSIARITEASGPLIDAHLYNAIKASPLLNPAQRQDLLDRFEQRLILSPSQIKAQVLDAVIEAGGFDYQGKLSLCRQAVGKQHITLLIRLEEEELFVWALEISTSSEGDALLKALVLSTKTVRIIPIRKIFSVRMLRTQLF